MNHQPEESVVPFLTIVIPAFNRENQIGRALGSCLGGTESDIEVIVVDDGSTDATSGRVLAVADPRVRLQRHASNFGVGPARNTGASAARGTWLAFLDSDDELLPGAIDTIRRRTTAVAGTVARCNFLYEVEGRGISPYPPPRADVLTYSEFVAWAGEAVLSDMFICVRRVTFASHRFPEDRGFEGLYHLDFHRRWTSRFFAERVARIHSDAPNRYSNLPLSARLRREIAMASAMVAQARQVQERHGAILAELAPRLLRRYVREEVVGLFLTGHRYQGLMRLRKSRAHAFNAVEAVAVALAGILGPTALGLAKAARESFRRSHRR